MPMGSVRLVPGVNVEATPTLAQTNIVSSNLIRFKDGLAQKLGGWTKYYSFPLSSTIRALLGWEDLAGDRNLGVGADESLSVITNGVNTDLTPQQTTTNVTPNFSTTNTSNVVTIIDGDITPGARNAVFMETPVIIGGLTLSGMYPIESVLGAHTYTILAASNATSTVPNAGTVPVFTTTSGSPEVDVAWVGHGFSVGSSVYFFVSTTVGGITISGAYIVQDVGSANLFTILGANEATSSTSGAMNGGEVRSLYYITIGPVALGSGYGVGGYGLGGYSTGSAAPSGEGTPITTTDWTLDNWGEILVACPINGAIYTWQPGSGYQTASVIETGPLANSGIFVAMPQQQLVAFGSATDGVQDPLLVRWSDVGDYTVWTATRSTQAGSYRLTSGSRIVGALQVPLNGLLWTDIDLWSMSYIGPPLVYGFQKIASGCGLVGPHAAGVLGGAIYWMSQGQFFVQDDGGVRSLPCSVWDAVFQNINSDHINKVVAAPNSLFNEIWWFYPSADATECDSYVKLNVAEEGGVWDYGTLGRTAWIDQSVLGHPIGAGTDDFIYQHETTKDADGSAMNPVLRTGYFMVNEGDQLAFIDWLLPDFKYGFYDGAENASIQITIYAVNYPGETPTVKGPYTVTDATRYINTRLRKRQVALQIESFDINSFWRIGNVRYRFAPDGRR